MLYSSSQVGMDAGLYFTLVSLLFSAISISNILDIIFTLLGPADKNVRAKVVHDVKQIREMRSQIGNYAVFTRDKCLH